MTMLRKLLSKGSFVRSVTVLAGGTALAQVITVAVSPFLTRLYRPEDFGLLGAYVAVLGLAVPLASWRYEFAIPLPKSEQEAFNLLIMALGTVVVMTALLALGIGVFGQRLVVWMKAPALRPYLWLLPVGLLGAGAYQALNYWAVRRQAFAVIARTKLAQSTGSVGTQLLAGLGVPGPLGLIAGHVVGQVGGGSSLARLVMRSWATLGQSISWRQMRAMAKRYWRFPVFSASASLFNSATTQVPTLLLTVFYGADVTGWFILGQRVLGAPADLIGNSIGQVYLSEAARLVGTDPVALRQLFFRTGGRMALIAAAPMLVIMVWGPWLFSRIFGLQWLAAGSYARLLAVWVFFGLVISPIASLNVLERQDLFLLWNVGRSILTVGGLFLSHRLGLGPHQAIGVYSLCMVIAYMAIALLWLLAVQQRIEAVARVH
jgi:O-antigen/teichoic acid export membrane protein